MGCGTLYKLTPESVTTWREIILYNFERGGGSGIFPSGTLFLDDPDHLFGMTRAGGDGIGTVFELQSTDKINWRQSQPHIFLGTPDGAGPIGRLVRDASGNLFGVTQSGGGRERRNGVVFELKHSKSGWTEIILHKFGGPEYTPEPSAGLVSDSQGHLYGTTKYGGVVSECELGCGTVYEVIP